MYYTYILENIPNPNRHYIGFTDNLKNRLAEHNAGKSKHTEKYRPWKLKVYLAFDEEETAIRFEKYLKSGSGRSFARRHF